MDCESEKKASIVYNALVVDKEVLLDYFNLRIVLPSGLVSDLISVLSTVAARQGEKGDDSF